MYIHNHKNTTAITGTGIGFSVFLKVSSVFGIGISKYRDIDIGIRYFSTFPLTCNELCLCHSSHFADSLPTLAQHYSNEQTYVGPTLEANGPILNFTLGQYRTNSSMFVGLLSFLVSATLQRRSDQYIAL